MIFLHDVNKNILTVRTPNVTSNLSGVPIPEQDQLFVKIQPLAASETKSKLLSRAFRAAFHTYVNKLSSFSKTNPVRNVNYPSFSTLPELLQAVETSKTKQTKT